MVVSLVRCGLCWHTPICCLVVWPRPSYHCVWQALLQSLLTYIFCTVAASRTLASFVSYELGPSTASLFNRFERSAEPIYEGYLPGRESQTLALWPQDDARWPHDGPKMAQDGFNVTQDGPKMASTRPNMVPRFPSPALQTQVPRPSFPAPALQAQLSMPSSVSPLLHAKFAGPSFPSAALEAQCPS